MTTDWKSWFNDNREYIEKHTPKSIQEKITLNKRSNFEVVIEIWLYLLK